MEKNWFDDVDLLRVEIDQLEQDVTRLQRELEDRKLGLQAESMRALLASGAFAAVRWVFEFDWLWGHGRRNRRVQTLKAESKKILESTTAIQRIKELLQSTYHCDAKLSENVSVRFDDDDVRLVFSSHEAMMSFCLEHGIRVNVDSLVRGREQTLQSIERSQREVEELSEFLALVEPVTGQILPGGGKV